MQAQVAMTAKHKYANILSLEITTVTNSPQNETQENDQNVFNQNILIDKSSCTGLKCEILQ